MVPIFLVQYLAGTETANATDVARLNDLNIKVNSDVNQGSSRTTVL